MSDKFTALFQPLQLTSKVQLKNRIVKTAQWFIYPEPDGSVGDRLVNFYRAVARGGPGMITVEESICDYPLGASNQPHIRLDDDRFIPGLSRLASAIHEYDVPAVVQITHAGPAHNPLQPNGGQPIAPSSIDPPSEPTFAMARELTKAEIEELIEKFAQAARRCKDAGFDGVELHSAHYALVNAFLSRRQNKRHDEYGCDTLENRARFPVSILKRMRELCGPDFVLGVRMNGREWGDPLGTTNEEAIAFAKMFEAAGANYLQVSAYGYGPFWMAAFPDYVAVMGPPDVKSFVDRLPDGALIPDAAEIRKAINIPVSGVGRLSFETAEKVVREGLVDLAAFGRHFMADPEFPIKLKEGRREDIRPCNGCLYCLHVLFLNLPVECRVNPFMGHEGEMIISPAEKRKKVLVIGAGPAGLEAARVAALRGHDVTVYDKASEIGGLMPMAAFIKSGGTDEIPPLLDWYERQLKNLNVKLSLGKEVTVDVVKKLAPDAVVVATGGKPVQAPISNGKVVTTEELKSRAKGFVRLLGPDALSALTKIFLPTGKRVVVVGSDLAALQTVEFLVKRGKQVTLVDTAENIGKGTGIHLLVKYPLWLQAVGVAVYTGVKKYKAVNKEGLVIETKEGQEVTLECDTVMVVTQYGQNTDLFDALEGIVQERYLVGDAASAEGPAYIHGAIRDGANVALKI
ncbi:MAG: NAD(P)/FAD-dependent oxidoreductase [Anaerolineales bacterium]